MFFFCYDALLQYIDVTVAGEPALKTTLTHKERANQRRAVDMLQQHCESLQAHATTLETDEQLLSGKNLTVRHRQAISARLEHKRLIRAAHSVLEKYKGSLTHEVSFAGAMRS